jgi:hypothetical protein
MVEPDLKAMAGIQIEKPPLINVKRAHSTQRQSEQVGVALGALAD